MIIHLPSEYFNFIEGIFWLVLGFICFGIYFKINEIYKRLTLFSALVLVTFGVSDFLQVAYGSFLVPDMEWLLIWKILDVVGLFVILTWYLILRFKC